MKPGYSGPARRLVSQEDAAMVQRPDVPRSKFIGQWSRKTTFDAGLLVPFLVDEVLPGDHLKYDVTAYLRLNTPLFPLMDAQRVDTFFFYVPSRILWSNWRRFMGEQSSPGDSTTYFIPHIQSAAGGFATHSVYDHMGIPTVIDAASTLRVNALPLRAYRLIYQEWFRDQNLSGTWNPAQTGDGPDPVAQYELYRRAKSADYFTTALPWPQKFTPPTVPLGGEAPIRGLAIDAGRTPTAGNPPLSHEGTLVGVAGPTATGWAGYYSSASANTMYVRAASPLLDADPLIWADLSQATGVQINTFRQAFLVQQLQERDARGGTRYAEIVQSHFGVTSPDMRLQRPEYIGGGSSPLDLTPIAQTAPSTGVPVGALGAAGTSLGQHRASVAATEHGYVIGLINVKTELSYQQGLHKMWTRSTRYDFYWPSLAGLGEQAILLKELYARGTAADDTVFGYQERWHEYRTRVSEVTGQFRSQASGTLDAWHFGQFFATAPVLGKTFIDDTPPMSRVLAAGASTANQQYLADILVRREAVRPIPMFGTPVTIGRF